MADIYIMIISKEGKRRKREKKLFIFNQLFCNANISICCII